MKEFVLLGVLFHLLGCLEAAQKGCVYLTVSSSSPADVLEINWSCAAIIRVISVYGQDPKKQRGARPLAQISVAAHPDGFFKTNITFSPEPFPGGWSRTSKSRREPKSHCLYWTVVYFVGRVTNYDCYRIYPAWMTENKWELKNLSLPLLFLPGTHNSGTDAMKAAGKRSVSHLDHFVLTQDQSVWNQLVYGIRFLDFRVGYYPEEDDPNLRFWINHDMLRVQPLVPVLKDIVEFSKSSPDEIIIIDFHRFPTGFQTKSGFAVHEEFIELLDNELHNRYILRPDNQFNLKLGHIWDSDGRIVVSYSDENMVAGIPWLWTSVSQRWGNKQTPEDLEKFLDNAFKDVAPKKLWAAMAELTPTPFDFLRNSSLRSMADRVNRKLSNWFCERPNWTRKANIVATDYFRGTNLIKLAIEENLRRAKQVREGLL